MRSAMQQPTVGALFRAALFALALPASRAAAGGQGPTAQGTGAASCGLSAAAHAALADGASLVQLVVVRRTATLCEPPLELAADDMNLMQVSMKLPSASSEPAAAPARAAAVAGQAAGAAPGRAATAALRGRRQPELAAAVTEGADLAQLVARVGTSAVRWAVLSAAKQSIVRLAWLGMAAVLTTAFGLRLRRQHEASQLLAACAEPEPVLEAPAEEAKSPEAELEPESLQLSELPQPMRRLRYIGASYVIPLARITRCYADFLTFDIPTLPCVWPLRAVLSRPMQKGAWTKLQLTVDIIAASELPPLLTCTRAGKGACPEDCGGTGGTGSPAHESSAGVAEEEIAMHSYSEDAGDDGGGCDNMPWLKICNAGGTVVATIMRLQDGSCIVQRQDRSSWDAAVHLDADVPWIAVSKQGQEIGQAASLCRGREEHLQVDTQPDVQSPESALLLMCMLAMLAF